MLLQEMLLIQDQEQVKLSPTPLLTNQSTNLATLQDPELEKLLLIALDQLFQTNTDIPLVEKLLKKL